MDRLRLVVFWLLVVTALVAVTVQVIEGPPGSGYGWGSVVASCLVLLVLFGGVALMVRSADRRFAWPAIVLAGVITAMVLMALAGNWSGQVTPDRLLDSATALLVVVACAGVLVVEVPLLRRSEGNQPPRGGNASTGARG